MTLSFRVPNWGWLHRLLLRAYPGLADRAERFGTARQNKRLLGGVIDFTTQVSVDD